MEFPCDSNELSLSIIPWLTFMFNAIDDTGLSGLEMGVMILEGGVGAGNVGAITELMEFKMWHGSRYLGEKCRYRGCCRVGWPWFIQRFRKCMYRCLG